METKKYTTHSSFWGFSVSFILWAILLLISIIRWQSPVATIISNSLFLVNSLVMAIHCRLAWHAYVEISEEGVRMKGCAKRISDSKKEKVDDIFIPWENIEKINVWDSTLFILITGEKIKLTQRINIDGRTLRKAFEQYKPKHPEQPQENPLEVVGVIGIASDYQTSGRG